LSASVDVAQLLVVSKIHGKIKSGGGMGIGASPGKCTSADKVQGARDWYRAGRTFIIAERCVDLSNMLERCSCSMQRSAAALAGGFRVVVLELQKKLVE